MSFTVSLEEARGRYPAYTFIAALTPSAQKAAFHVRDSNGLDLCLKIISPDYDMDRLKREILALQTVRHPNVALLKEYTFSSRPGWQCHHIIEEFVPGDDLSVSLKPGEVWPRTRAARPP